jgi:diguanylate cyclase (GGDEF)-like protein
LTAPAPARHVLIVDDHAPNVHVLAEVLRDRYRVSFATTGSRALELAPAADLILLDVQLPDVDGFEVCRRLKADEATRDIPVIFVTARGQVSDETRGFDVGGVDYITKPISAPVVRARVRTHLELKENRDLLAELAARDGLTGAANRRGFDAALDREWRRARRAEQPLTLVMLDIDHFKLYNDRYGHARGDDCLRAVAGLLRDVCRRPGDVVARYGGEEFALVLPGIEGEGARSLTRSVWSRLAEQRLEHAASPTAPVVTASGGAVSHRPEDGGEPRLLVEHADRLLYAAKQAGRARVIHGDGLEKEGAGS